MEKLNHLAIIMDGNRRWAKKEGLPGLQGHYHGYLKLKEFGDWCVESGIKFLSIYAFSTENWNRTKKEVSYLMGLLIRILKENLEEYHKKGVRMKIIGQWERYPEEIQKLFKEAEKLTKNNKKITLIICLSYGGRTEIVEAVKKIIQQGKPVDKINEELILKNLYAPDVPAPDLILRTSGEMRLSNFLTWQSVYSELYFTKTLWPDFSKKEFNDMLREYNKRQRRFGK